MLASVINVGVLFALGTHLSRSETRPISVPRRHMWRMSDKTFCVLSSINRWPKQQRQQQEQLQPVLWFSSFLAFRVDFVEWPGKMVELKR